MVQSLRYFCPVAITVRLIVFRFLTLGINACTHSHTRTSHTYSVHSNDKLSETIVVAAVAVAYLVS